MRADPIGVDARFAFSEGHHRLSHEADQMFLDHEANQGYRIQLQAYEQRPVNLRINLGALPQRGQFVGFQVAQNHGRNQPIGSLGVVIQGR